MADSSVWPSGVMQMSLADSLVALPLGFTAHFSLIYWSEEKEETARSLRLRLKSTKYFEITFSLSPSNRRSYKRKSL